MDVDMLSILFTNNSPFNPSYGGIERATDILVRALLKKGYTIFYLSSGCSNPDMMNYQFPTTQHLLPSKNLYCKENKEFYINFIRDNNIQIVVNQRGLLIEGNFYIRMLPSNVKLVSCFHSKPFGYWEISKDILFLNNKTFVEHIKCFIKLITFPLSLYLLKKIEYNKTKKQLENAVNNSDCAVFLSDNYINVVLKRCCIQHSKMLSIPNPNTYSENDIIKRPKEKIILFVGRLTSWDKRPESLLQIWSNVFKKFPDWSLYYVGHGEQIDKLKQVIHKKKLERVYLEGKQDPLTYYNKSSILCMTSAYEGFPMVLTEAMQNGVVPVIYNSFGAASDIIEQDNDGFLIQPFDSVQYTKVLTKLMTDSELRLSMQKKAILSSKRFDVNNIILKWEKLFNRLIEK